MTEGTLRCFLYDTCNFLSFESSKETTQSC